ncbi:MAG: hypothetical protein DME38_00020 [Verrucomicrobia bacterium]|nr:MAG: hypothetical protein DME38_00020 [Verrucomicrobiota bacterium]
MTEEGLTQSGGKMMKTFLLLIISSVVAAGVLPSLPAKLVLSAIVLMAALTQAAHRAPLGLEHETGFYLIRTRRRMPNARVLLRAGRKMLMTWLFSDARRPVRA